MDWWIYFFVVVIIIAEMSFPFKSVLVLLSARLFNECGEVTFITAQLTSQ